MIINEPARIESLDDLAHPRSKKLCEEVGIDCITTLAALHREAERQIRTENRIDYNGDDPNSVGHVKRMLATCAIIAYELTQKPRGFKIDGLTIEPDPNYDTHEPSARYFEGLIQQVDRGGYENDI